jgi:tetratricopeptide (TPR) repeat protein
LVGQQEFERARLLNDEQHNYRGAQNAWEQALKAFEQAGGRVRDGITLLNIGLTYEKEGQFQQAIGNLKGLW